MGGFNTLKTSRRRFLRQLRDATAAGVVWRLPLPLIAAGSTHALGGDALHRKHIPNTGEHITAVGMGTYITFNVGPDNDARDRLARVMRTFFDMGGGVIDSSPMYGTAEEVLGDLLERIEATGSGFSATKVWTRSTDEGATQIDRSMALWGVARFDLMQVHNLVNWRPHLETMRVRRDAGDLRYIGVTTSHGRRHEELERIMSEESIDFVQLTYNVVDREVEKRILPLARERGIAVIANRPFRRGNLFDRVGNAALPTWAAQFGIDNWAQYFLKFITSHDDVTCAIPATSRVEHMQENMGALRGPIPDAAVRQKMLDYLQRL